jgi:hypothetical protein
MLLVIGGRFGLESLIVVIAPAELRKQIRYLELMDGRNAIGPIGPCAVSLVWK